MNYSLLFDISYAIWIQREQRRVIGHTFTTLLPPDVIDLKVGEYSLEEVCLYCDDDSDDENEGDDYVPQVTLIKNTLMPFYFLFIC